MQTQNYANYMHFLVLKESEQKCARAFCEKMRMSARARNKRKYL